MADISALSLAHNFSEILWGQRTLQRQTRNEPLWQGSSTALGGTSAALFRTVLSPFILVMFTLAICNSRGHAAIFPDSGPTTPGAQAVLHGGIALAPTQAPLAVKRA